VTGASMGGFGAWSHLLARPEIWAAGAPIAGTGIYHRGAENLLARLRGMPIYILHGELDEKCPVEPAREASRRLEALDIPHVFVEVPGCGHSPPLEEFLKLCGWIQRTPPKAWSPRPLFLPSAGEAPVWKEYEDPFDLKTPDQVMALIAEGKFEQARQQIDKQLRMNSANSHLYTMRAMTLLPGLADPFPLSLRPQDFDVKRGWGAKNEAQALAELDRALRSKTGSAREAQLFTTRVRLMRAQIYAKQFAMAADGRRSEWLPKYSAFVRETADLPNTADVRRLRQAVRNRVPGEFQPAPPKPRPRDEDEEAR
jgi:hypothetical protein